MEILAFRLPSRDSRGYRKLTRRQIEQGHAHLPEGHSVAMAETENGLDFGSGVREKYGTRYGAELVRASAS